MACTYCKSTNQSTYPGEINIHFPGAKGLETPTVWAFPSLLVCLDCGVTQFTISDSQLRRLRGTDYPAAAAS